MYIMRREAPAHLQLNQFGHHLNKLYQIDACTLIWLHFAESAVYRKIDII